MKNPKFEVGKTYISICNNAVYEIVKITPKMIFYRICGVDEKIYRAKRRHWDYPSLKYGITEKFHAKNIVNHYEYAIVDSRNEYIIKEDQKP